MRRFKSSAFWRRPSVPKLIAGSTLHDWSKAGCDVPNWTNRRSFADWQALAWIWKRAAAATFAPWSRPAIALRQPTILTGLDQCLLFNNLDKPLTFRHNDRDVTRNAGDMTILDSRHPSSSSTPFGAKTMFINMPRQALARRFLAIEHIAGTAFTAASPLADFSRD
jgi:hypothetical protein